ncbi:MAG TPA: xanthine dehydrogenase family protein subunit M [Candidatus Tectomicrobia bacterium]|nr:xanthine dehydrogenase family protein subunit M [Candidatus Tectomicrobia bacterium]
MIPSAFQYLAPTSLQEAISLLSTHQEEAKVLAGGHSLLPMMKLRLAAPAYIIDLGRIPNLAYIRENGGHIQIGPMTTHFTVESSDLLRQRLTALAEAAGMIGDVQVRNRGTIGGSLAHADPAGDLPAVMQMAEAQFKLIGPGGERIVRTEQFFVDLLTTALGPNELLAEIQVSVPPTRTGTAYMKVFQKASGFAIVGVAARVTLGADGRTCQTARLGITGVAAKSFRARGVEQGLEGKTIDEAAITVAAEHTSDGVDALSDLHASGEYRLALARVYTKRTLLRALARAQGGTS